MLKGCFLFDCNAKFNFHHGQLIARGTFCDALLRIHLIGTVNCGIQECWQWQRNEINKVWTHLFVELQLHPESRNEKS